MSKHLGDFDASTVVYGKFSTFRPSTGAAFTLGGTPALSVYKDNSTTQSTTGVTLTADFDTVTGLNHFAIDTSADGTFYAAGSFFDIVITTGTVDSVSVVGSVVASFTIRKNSALKPATAGRTLVVDAAGLADANTVKVGPSGSGSSQTARDIGASVLLSSGTGTGQLKLASGYVAMTWADIAAPTTTVNLSGTTIAATQKVDVETIKTNPVVNGGTITFPTGATLASTTNITAGTITTTTSLTNKTGFSLASTGLDSVTAWTVNITGSITGSLSGSVGSVTGSVGSVASGGIAAASFAAGAIDAAAIATDALGSLELAAGAATEVATAVWATATRELTSGANIVLAKGTGVTGFNDLSAAQVNAEADTALADYDGPTHTELTAELATADDAVLAAIAGLSFPTANENADALLDRADAIEAGLTPRHAMRLSAAADGGKLSGAATATNTIRNAVADTKNRIVASVDADGNRTAITYDLSD